MSVPLLGAKALAQEAPGGRALKQRRVTLSRSMADTPVELHVAPSSLTALEFDSRVERDAVTFGDAGGRFSLFEVGPRLVVLKPASELAKGERVLLTVPFADDLAPARAVFALVTHPSEVDVQVQVSRLPRTAEAVQAELDEVRTACAGKDAELEALRMRGVANGPAGMILSGLLDSNGIEASQLETKREESNGLKPLDVFAYQGRGWAAVSLEVRNTGSTPWIPTEARLSFSNGRQPRVLPVRMKEARIEPGGTALLVVETGVPDWLEGTTLQLELRERVGTRHLLFPSFVF